MCGIPSTLLLNCLTSQMLVIPQVFCEVFESNLQVSTVCVLLTWLGLKYVNYSAGCMKDGGWDILYMLR